MTKELKRLGTLGVLVLTNLACAPVSFKEAEKIDEASTAAACTELTAEDFKPKLKWDWAALLDLTKAENYPDYLQVMASPVVGDLNADGVPEVVFVTWGRTFGYQAYGVLRIVDGSSGRTIRSIGEDAVAPFGSTTPLLIDIDGDGKVEIVYAHHTGTKLVALNYDGSTRWIFDTAGYVIKNYRGFSAIDSDRNGKAEIILGSISVTEDAHKQPVKVWQAEVQQLPGYSYAVSLNPAQPQEVSFVTYSGVFDKTGKQLYPTHGAIYAAGNLDGRGGLELVGTSQGWLRIVDGVTGERKLDLNLDIYNELKCSKGIGGGPATLGDFDGRPETTEIAVATGRYLIIMNAAGELMSKYPTQDCSSLVTGISSFDFNGDGKPEILYGDEEYFRVFEMRNGQLEVVFSTPNPSGTLHEYPVVADIDGNKSSEILVVANNYAAANFYKDPGEIEHAEIAKTITGIRAFESNGRTKWMPTRSLWNSYDYNPALVTESLRSVSSTPFESFTARIFRRNAQLGQFEKMCVK